jgi:hypothetical protein
MISLHLDPQELALICDALDSHIYWQLSDDHYRRDGHVREPGSDDADQAAELQRTEALLRRLQTVVGITPGSEQVDQGTRV